MQAHTPASLCWQDASGINLCGFYMDCFATPESRVGFSLSPTKIYQLRIFYGLFLSPCKSGTRSLSGDVKLALLDFLFYSGFILCSVNFPVYCHYCRLLFYLTFLGLSNKISFNHCPDIKFIPPFKQHHDNYMFYLNFTL